MSARIPEPDERGGGMASGPDGRIDRMPILILNPHSRCNCRCVMCDIWRAKQRDMLDADEIEGWMPEMRSLGVEQVVLSGGEALLHGDLSVVCARLKAAGLRITLLSTGLLLAANAEWIAGSVEEVIVSLDGPEEVHDSIRGISGAYGKMAAGIEALRKLESRFRVAGRSVVQRGNFRCLRATVRAAHSLELDSISFLAADVSSEAFNRPGGWSNERAQSVALDLSETQQLAAEVEALETECASDFESGFIVESPAKLRSRIVQYYRALNGFGDFAMVRCKAPWVSSVIEANGDVRPCFFHPRIGNVRASGGLKAVINSTRAVDFRRRLDVRTDPICKRCVCSFSARERRPK